MSAQDTAGGPGSTAVLDAAGLAALPGRVGQELGVSAWKTVAQPRIDAFADATEDWQYIHNDPVRAAETPFGGTVAHGFLTLSLLSVLMVDALPWINSARIGINYGFDKVRFLAAVPTNARIRGRFTLSGCDLASEVPGQVTLRWDVRVEVEGSDKPAILARWITRHVFDLT